MMDMDIKLCLGFGGNVELREVVDDVCIGDMFVRWGSAHRVVSSVTVPDHNLDDVRMHPGFEGVL
jgi:hypothetical protein